MNLKSNGHMNINSTLYKLQYITIIVPEEYYSNIGSFIFYNLLSIVTNLTTSLNRNYRDNFNRIHEYNEFEMIIETTDIILDL